MTLIKLYVFDLSRFLYVLLEEEYQVSLIHNLLLFDNNIVALPELSIRSVGSDAVLKLALSKVKSIKFSTV